MAYFALCTFDLKNASSQDYQNAYADLERLGFKRVVVADNSNNVVIPTTTVAGEFNSSSAAAVRAHLCDQVQAAFRARRFTSEIFVLAAGDWAWGGRTT
jgi:hypothetical protein